MSNRILFLAASLMIAGTAFAEPDNARVSLPSSTASVPAGAPAMTESQSIAKDVTVNVEPSKNKFSVIYWSQFSGPSIGHPTSYTPDPTGDLVYDDDHRQNLVNQIITGYSLSQNVSVGPVVQFDYFPTRGQEVGLTDIFFKVRNGKFIDRGNFTWSADLRVYTPITAAYQAQSFLSALGSLDYATYQFQNSKWSMNLLTIFKTDYYTDPLADKNPVKRNSRLEFSATPILQYQATPTLAATFSSDVINGWSYGVGNAISTQKISPIDFYPGVSWDITPKLNFNPFVMVIPSNLSLNSTSVGAYITATLL